ncbi:prepilin-type N-terminal cleavage/methylation domain-containing protein [Candidatus Albibeggiatoa sp. nov. NOAA]|uniref:prepilin-type N-terminal cleavage/methylation domain-containing protein n=1 Tax=Candidatus Albibeggiatoa sp. nov. NOAA TaxID=3162724 RepID=UPI0032F164A9|nr:type II secretion system protein GspJ [Thiotrichaceae bacterium]
MQRSNGFTLLELLISLALSASIMLLLAAGMQVVLKDWERNGSRLDRSLDQVLILLQLERALDAAYPHTYVDEDKKQQVVFFIGEEDKLAWVSTLSPGRTPGLTAWQLSRNEDGESGVEIRTIPAFANDPTESLEEIEEPTVAFEDYDVSFEYLYYDDQFDDKDTEWLEEWQGEDRRSLPNAVRIVLESQERQEQSLEIIAHIKAFEHASLPRIKP